MKNSLLKLAAVVTATGLSRSSVYRLMGEGAFPQQVHIPHTNRVGWRESDVEAWLASAELDPDLAAAARQKAQGAQKARENARKQEAAAV